MTHQEVDKIANDPVLPLTLYGPELSYFTGKLEAVIRYMELPYQRVVAGPMGQVSETTGVAQVPALHLADDRWLTDTTPMIAWLDQRYPGGRSWTLALLVAGLAVGCFNAWHWVAKEDKAMRDEQEDHVE